MQAAPVLPVIAPVIELDPPGSKVGQGGSEVKKTARQVAQEILEKHPEWHNKPNRWLAEVTHLSKNAFQRAKQDMGITSKEGDELDNT